MPTSFLNTWLWFWIMHSGFSGLCPATHALICYKERRGSVNQICKSRLIKLLIECFDKVSVQIHGTEISRGPFFVEATRGHVLDTRNDLTSSCGTLESLVKHSTRAESSWLSGPTTIPLRKACSPSVPLCRPRSSQLPVIARYGCSCC